MIDYAEKRRLRDAYVLAQAETFARVAVEVAALMPGWLLVPESETRIEWRRYDLTRDSLHIGLSLDRTKYDRINISAHGWPEYTEYLDRTCPSISVALNRPAAAIHSEIQRRLLPDYVRLFAACMELAMNRQAYQVRCRDTWAEICSIIGKKPDSAYHYGPGGMTLQKRGDSTARLEMDVTPDMLKKIVAAL